MKIGRREFLLSAGLTTIVASPRSFAGQTNQAAFAKKRGRPVVQTLTDETTAQFVVLVDPRKTPVYRARTSGGRELRLTLISRERNPFEDDQALDRLLVEGLDLEADHVLEIFEGATAAKVDERVFRAFDTRPRATRFAIASCMADVLEAFQGPMWKAMADTKPDAIFLVGDTCYADILTDGSVRGFWKRQIQTRKALDVFRWKRLVPVFATWDDHDYGKNNGNRTLATRDEALRAFRALWGWEPRGPAEHGPGVSSALDLCGQRIILMDDRYFRDPRGVERGMHWGSGQQDWMLRRLASDPRPAWIMNGSQIFGGYLGKESFESDHPENLRDVAHFLASIEAPVLFASGDVHFSEVMKIEKERLGYETFELTSSSIHSATYPGGDAPGKNPRRIKSTWHHNFLVVDSSVDSRGELVFKASAVSGRRHVHFQVGGKTRRSSGGLAV